MDSGKVRFGWSHAYTQSLDLSAFSGFSALPPIRPNYGDAVEGMPTVMVYSDIDDTFVPWQVYNQKVDEKPLQRTQAALQKYEGSTVNALCSARGLTSIQELVPYLRDVPLTMIGTNGGQQVYFNHFNLPTDSWLMSLQVQDADPHWNQQVAQSSGGFSTQRALSELRGTLSELGFSRTDLRLPAPHEKRELHIGYLPEAPEQEVVVAIVADQTSFMVRASSQELKAPMSEGHRKLAAQIGQRMQERLEDQGIRGVSKRFIKDDVHEIYLIEPDSIGKDTLLQHLITRFPGVRHVITAGDHVNDDHLHRETYNGVENYRIVSGDRAEVIEPLIGQPRVTQVSKGDIGAALEPKLANLIGPESTLDRHYNIEIQ